MSWVPLHVHSQFSILQSTASIKDLIQKAKEHQTSALAITDFCNMFGVVDFYKAATGAQIKPLIGMEIMVAPQSRFEKKKTSVGAYAYPLTLLAKNAKGYRNLCKLSSLAYTEGFYYTPRIDKELLASHSEGIICLSGSSSSLIADLAFKSSGNSLDEEIEWFLKIFGEDYYFELQNHEMREEKIAQQGISKESWLYQKYTSHIQKQKIVRTTLIEKGKQKGVVCVATNEIKYLEPDDYKAQEILMNIQAGEVCEIWERDHQGRPLGKTLNPKREVLYSHEYYFKSPDQMAEAFKEFPEAVSNTLQVAEKIDFSFDFNRKFYPVFIPPALETKKFTDEERTQAAAHYLKQLCYDAIPQRYQEQHLAKVAEKYPGQDPMQVVKDRLKLELDIIIPKGLGDYLLIVHDFISWAKSKGIPVGPGRGSGVGSIILYLIGVTDIEPLRFSLFFERFINPDRISYPDIDVDICMDRRQEVIDYTIQKYGKEKVAQIITFGTMKAKMAIKDVGRVLNIPLTKVNEIAKLVPEDLNITIEKALEVDPDLKRLYDTDEEAKRLIDFAKKVEGSIRNTGIHAAGLIICGDSLTDHIPVCVTKDAEILATQFSMKPVEMVGMLKIDFLGLKTLTSIQKAVDLIKKHTKTEIDWSNLPLEDQKTFDLLNQGKTLGIFQLESAGMRDLARQLHIDKFEEIIAVGALYRPGPMEMIPSFINRKHGLENIEIDHPLMADILKETYGIIVYQEQVMQIAQTLANYSLGEGDVLRRAMGKKDKDEMARQGEKFKAGALANNISEELGMMIFNKVEKFASYGFNKSHATAYAYLTYVTSYLKANYTKEWMSALMTCDLDDLSKVSKHIRECQSLSIPILSPDINESYGEFVPTLQGIRFGMAAIKGIGEGVVESIVHERDRGGKFRDLEEFIERIDPKKVGKKAIESLIDAGCFDSTGNSRIGMKATLEETYDIFVKQQKEKQKGVMDFFSSEDLPKIQVPEVSPMGVTENLREKLRREKELLGFYLTGHPLEEFREQIQKLACTSFEEILQQTQNSVCKIAFVVDTLQIKLSNKSQKKFAIITISDGFERFELPVWSDIYMEKAPLFEETKLLYGVVTTDRSDEEVKISLRWVEDLSEIDDQRITECQSAYESIKKQFEAGAKKRKMGQQAEEAPQQTIPNKKLKISLDVGKMRLSHVLSLKKVLEDFSGDTPYFLEFYRNQSLVNIIEIDSMNGLLITSELERVVKQLPFCLDVQLTK